MKQLKARRDHEQPVGELMDVQRDISRSRSEAQMHEPILDAVIQPPRAAFQNKNERYECVKVRKITRQRSPVALYAPTVVAFTPLLPKGEGVTRQRAHKASLGTLGLLENISVAE